MNLYYSSFRYARKFSVASSDKGGNRKSRESVRNVPEPMEELLEGIEVEPKSLPPVGTEFSVTYESWVPDTPEDQHLVSYWEDVSGAIIAEVPTANGGPSRCPDLLNG